MAVNNRPLLIFPEAQYSERDRRPPPGPAPRLPSRSRQSQRLAPQFAALERAFELRRVELRSDLAHVVPEEVLVLETVGSVQDFAAAVRRTPGMEWLFEWDQEEVAPDDDFYLEANPERGLDGRLFLVMSNQQALQELLALWRRYREIGDVGWPRGRARWRDLFSQLRNIRPWDVQDRLLATGILDDWRERIQEGQETVRLEAELWYRTSEQEQRASQRRLESLLVAEGGRFIAQTILPQIAYHAILAELPIAAVNTILNHPDTALVRCERVMFFRAVGQAAIVTTTDEPLVDRVAPSSQSVIWDEPIVALLDGLPLENHQWLRNRLLVNDPDGWAAQYPVDERHHGTAMASLILHGDLNSNDVPLSRRLYVRPILRPDSLGWSERKREAIPEDVLPIDLIHRAIRRMFDGEAGEPPVAPSVCIVNLSVCDAARPFDRFLSPWARLIDWLAWQYKCLFVISVGNYEDALILDVPRESFADLGPEQREAEVLKAISGSMVNRRLLAPSEAVNAISVGALHIDGSATVTGAYTTDLLCSNRLPSPISRFGPGFRRAVKPDILMAGGRQVFRERLDSTYPTAALNVVPTTQPPGQCVATPGAAPGDLTKIRYSRGTSNAAALTSRTAALLYDVLQDLRDQPGGDMIEDKYLPVLLKSMLVHAARWGDSSAVLEARLGEGLSASELRKRVTRFLGYGALYADRVRACTEERVTIIGCSEIGDGRGHVYSVPLPPSLSSRRVLRRLTITLAWLTPTNPKHRSYRRAALWFKPPLDILRVGRTDVDWQAVQRGTVQHEVLEGDRAAPYTDGEVLQIQVNCRADAGDIQAAVPYALLASLEVAEGLDIPIYEEVRARIRPQVGVSP